jgi:hypothetical protein
MHKLGIWIGWLDNNMGKGVFRTQTSQREMFHFGGVLVHVLEMGGFQ